MTPTTPIRLLAVMLLLGAPAVSVAQAEPEAEPAAEAAEERALAGDQELDDPIGLEPAALDKLSAEQIVELLNERERTRRRQFDKPEWEAVIVPTVMFVFIGVAVFLVVFFRFRRDRLRHETLRAMVEKGADIPAELLVPPTPRKTSWDLRWGLVFAGTGLGLLVFLGVLDADMPAGTWSAGLIPILIGAGFLAAWWIDKKNNGNGNGNQATSRPAL